VLKKLTINAYKRGIVLESKVRESVRRIRVKRRKDKEELLPWAAVCESCE
jgi:hypothetical protein